MLRDSCICLRQSHAPEPIQVPGPIARWRRIDVDFELASKGESRENRIERETSPPSIRGRCCASPHFAKRKGLGSEAIPPRAGVGMAR
jgi:hypothetical protein